MTVGNSKPSATRVTLLFVSLTLKCNWQRLLHSITTGQVELHLYFGLFLQHLAGEIVGFAHFLSSRLFSLWRCNYNTKWIKHPQSKENLSKQQKKNLRNENFSQNFFSAIENTIICNKSSSGVSDWDSAKSDAGLQDTRRLLKNVIILWNDRTLPWTPYSILWLISWMRRLWWSVVNSGLVHELEVL